jgi:hypothetical protein
VLFTLIFLGGEIAGWLLCAYLPWLAVSVATKGEAGLGMLGICLFAGLVCAMAVPFLGATDATGLWVSFLVAAAVPALLLTLRRITLVERPGAVAAGPKDDAS